MRPDVRPIAAAVERRQTLAQLDANAQTAATPHP